MAQKITVLLVDDHALVRRGFRRILEDEAHITVVGEASNGAEAVRMACDLKPRAILMDLAMPELNGLQTTRQILQACPDIAVVILSMHSEETWARQAVEAGARGYVSKNVVELDLVSTIKRVVAGESVFGPQASPRPTLGRARRRGLSRRELEVLQLIADGKSNREIANQLDLSPNTVAVHRTNILDALDVCNSAELVAYAIRNGLVNIL